MQQHVLDDRIGAFAVLHHFLEVAFKHMGQFVELFPGLAIDCCGLKNIVHLLDQLGRQRREIIDEIKRVLDLMGDAGGELSQRRHLLGLDQVRLRRLQVAIG